jgi:hypothetical protein
MNLIQLTETKERGYGGDRLFFHATCENSKHHEGDGIPDKTKATLTRVVKRLLARIFTQHGVKVKYVRIDSERGYADLWGVLKDLGIIAERRATGAQSGLPERAGRTVVTLSRAVQIGANLPKELATEICLSVIYMLNRTPTEALGWKTPYEVVRGVRPTVAWRSSVRPQHQDSWWGQA